MCSRQESNLQSLRHWPLMPACIPFPPLERDVRKARGSNPQPFYRHVISNDTANRSLTFQKPVRAISRGTGHVIYLFICVGCTLFRQLNYPRTSHTVSHGWPVPSSPHKIPPAGHTSRSCHPMPDRPMFPCCLVRSRTCVGGFKDHWGNPHPTSKALRWLIKPPKSHLTQPPAR